MLTATPPSRSSNLYNGFYYAHCCGRPYRRSPEWEAFFGGIADRIVSQLRPTTVLDAGCAKGFLVEALRDRGVEAYGIDISGTAIDEVRPDIRPYCRVGSLTDPLPRTYDLIVCIEVLEHLTPADGDLALANLCAASSDILYSSSPDDFQELTHFNVQPPEAWAARFARHGFLRDFEYDATFVTAWAVRFRRGEVSPPHVVAEYERRLWRMERQCVGLRSAGAGFRELAERQEAELQVARQDHGRELDDARRTVADLRAELAGRPDVRQLADGQQAVLGAVNDLQAAVALLTRQVDEVRQRVERRPAEGTPGGGRLDRTEYADLIRSVREAVQAAVPAGATLAVVSKGDADLLKHEGMRAWHFPQTAGGVYAGYHPADSADAIRYLEEIQAKGAEYLVIPATSAWWLDHYGDFKGHLDARCRKLHGRGPCVLYDLTAPPDDDDSPDGATPDDDYRKWAKRCEALRYDPARATAEVAGFAHRPVVSIVVPVYNPPAEFLRKAIESVLAQYYPHWELCLHDDGSTAADVAPILDEYARRDPRVKVSRSPANGGISAASNRALALATGEFVGLLDHDDELTPDALVEVVAALQGGDVDFVYSDEDKLDPDGRRCQPFFKPAWSPDLLLSCMYTCHFSVYRRSLVEDVGGFREGYEGSQDHDLALRVVERTDRVAHVPRVLYHWRMIPGSAAAGTAAKPYAYDAARRALRDALDRRGEPGDVFAAAVPGHFRVRRAVAAPGLVSIIVPTRDRVDLLRRCIDSIEANTRAADYELVVVDNGSTDPAAVAYLRGLPHRVIRDDGPFNYSRLNNRAAAEARGRYLLLLNNDIEVLDGDWLPALLEHAQRPAVGAVGAKLLYPDGRVQHAGVVVGMNGVANHAHRLIDGFTGTGYFNFANATRNYSAVTAACLMLRRDVFLEAGGFNEADLAVSFNDVDLCLRLRERGYAVVYTPHARLVHHESASRGFKVAAAENDYMCRRWAGAIRDDSFFNPNLDLSSEAFRPDYSKPEAFVRVAGCEAADAAVPLPAGRRLGQRFVCPEAGLCGVAVVPATHGRRVGGTLRLRLTGSHGGDPVAVVAADARKVRDNQPFLFIFEPVADSAGRTLEFTVDYEPAADDALAVWTSREADAAGTLTFRAYCLCKARRAGAAPTEAS